MNQLPFSSINYGTCTEPEGRMVIKAILDVSIEGMGKNGKTSIFPCGIFQYKKGVNDKPGTPNYDLYRLALRSTAQRLYPNYANCDWNPHKKWVQADRDIKIAVVDNLTQEDYNKLINRIEEYPDVADKLYLRYVKDSQWDKIRISDFERPFELFSTMGCRTVNGLDVNFKEVYEENIKSFIETGELKHPTYLSAIQKDGRGNICPVTIIMPELAMQIKSKYNDDLVEPFMKLLEKKIYEAKDMLIERFNHICSQSEASAKFMWENGSMEGYDPSEGIKSSLKHGTLVIGQLGLAETLQILIGEDHTNENGMELAKRIEKLFNEKCAEFKSEYKLNFGVYYTPAENLCYTAMSKFKRKWGEIPNVSDKKYFTNSMHVPVWCSMDPFQKINIESELTGYSNAGCITYVELPSSAINNIDALEAIVGYAMDKDIPYQAINVPVDRCRNCHYTDEINDVCPKCGSDNILRLRRVTGYISNDYRHFNKGKQQEVEDRVKHMK